MRGIRAIALLLVSIPVLGATISGRVVSCDGTVIPGAIVSLPDGTSAVTDSEGSFTLESPDGETLLIVARLEGMFPGEVQVRTRRDRETFVELLLTPNVISCCTVVADAPDTQTIAGKVADGNGTPIEGATVRVLDLSSAPVAAVWSGADGAFRIDALPFAEYTLEISAPAQHTMWVKIRLSRCSANCLLSIRLSKG